MNANMRCQRCGQFLRQGQVMCIGCGSALPTPYARPNSGGIGCVGLIVGFLLVVTVLVGTAVGLFVSYNP